MMLEIKNLEGKILYGEELKKHTWLGVGGPAEVMFFPKNDEDLRIFLQNKPENMPVFILGGGSNLLVRDGGIKGAVVKLNTPYFKEIEIEKNSITCKSGVLNSSLKKILIENELGGLEFLCSIPGTIGGLVKTNAGCFSKSLSDVLLEATIMDADGNKRTVMPEEFHFSYRKSDFPASWIILSLKLKTQKDTKENIALIIKEQALYRKKHQPMNVKTAGSTFKNPNGERAWELIKQANADTLSVGGAKLSDIHCNFMINENNASALDLEMLGEKIIQKVKEKTGITLAWEIEKIGDN